MSLGSLSDVSKENHKALADRIEEIITGLDNSLFLDYLIIRDLKILKILHKNLQIILSGINYLQRITIKVR